MNIYVEKTSYKEKQRGCLITKIIQNINFKKYVFQDPEPVGKKQITEIKNRDHFKAVNGLIAVIFN